MVLPVLMYFGLPSMSWYGPLRSTDTVETLETTRSGRATGSGATRIGAADTGASSVAMLPAAMAAMAAMASVQRARRETFMWASSRVRPDHRIDPSTVRRFGLDLSGHRHPAGVQFCTLFQRRSSTPPFRWSRFAIYVPGVGVELRSSGSRSVPPRAVKPGISAVSAGVPFAWC